MRQLTMRLTVALGCLGAQRVDGVGDGRSGGAPAIHGGRRLDPGDVVASGSDARPGKREKTSTVLVDRSGGRDGSGGRGDDGGWQRARSGQREGSERARKREGGNGEASRGSGCGGR